MHKPANVILKVHISFQLVFSTEFVTFLGVIRGGGQRPKNTKCDIGLGVKNIDLLGDILFEWPFMR